MRYWASLLPLSATVCSTLNEAGLQPWPEGDSAPPDADSLLLYDSPDHLIAMVKTGPDTCGLSALNLLQGYRRLLACSEQSGQPLLSISDLQRLGPEGLRTLLVGGDIASIPPAPPLPIPPLLASVTLSLLEAEPALLDCYSDLELRAVLLGRDPDLRYRERLRQAGQRADALLQAFLTSQRVLAAAPELEQRLSSRDTDLKDAREAAEAAELALLQLHQQVQEEREQFLLAEDEKQRQHDLRDRQLEELRLTKAAQESAHELELQALRERLEPQLAEMEQRLSSRDTELLDQRDAAELSMLHIHQLQEELEDYLLAEGQKHRQLEARDRELVELRRFQAALESAHELELQALRERLEPQLAELEQRLSSRDRELKDSSEAAEAAELALLHLHQQVQEERERGLLAEDEKQRQQEARDRELEELRRTTAALQSAHELELVALCERLEPQLAELEHRLASRDSELHEAKERAEQSLRQLHQVQEELEHYFLADGEKQRQLEVRERELEELRLTRASQERVHELEQQALRELLEPQLAELNQRLDSRDTELMEAREAAELSILQLHQVQEELEHYFLNARASNQLAQAQSEQLQRARRLMLRLQPDVAQTAPYSPALAVNILPELASSMHNSTLQTEALLNTYAASLQRASALLERARRP
jgi:hypothetical protein